MTTPGTVPSPWGEPARTPPATATTSASPAQSTQSAQDKRESLAAPARPAARRLTSPHTQTAPRWDLPGHWERMRAAATLAFVAIILGAAAAGVLGVSVWAIAALFHHAASG